MADNRIERMHAMAKRLHANGTLNKTTMRELDALAINASLKEMDGNKIQQLRKRENISQGVLAAVLNMSSESVQKWEQGKTSPKGAALRLLNIIEQRGIAAVL